MKTNETTQKAQDLIAIAVQQATPATITAPQSNKALAELSQNWAFRTFKEPELLKMLWAAETMRKQAIREAVGDPASVPGYILTLSGPNGIGKTYLSHKLHRFIVGIATGRPMVTRFDHVELRNCLYCHWTIRCQSAIEGDWESFARMQEAWFLIIDDFGAEHDPRGVFLEKFVSIIDWRDRRRMFTLITTNLTMPQIQGRDKRLASRLIRHENQFLSIDAQDYALRKP